MRMRDFYAECVKRAARGKLLHVEAISGLLALLAVPVAALWDPRSQFLNWVPLAIFGAVFVGTLIFGFLTAPYWIATEFESQRDALAGQLDMGARRQAAVDQLWDLRSNGIRLRNERLANDEAVEDWAVRINAWRDEVLSASHVVSVNLRNWLDRLDHTVSAPNNIPIVNSHHDQLVRVTSEMLLRMEQYLLREFLR